MEITATPPEGRRRRVLGRVLAALLLLAVVALLAPIALGFQAHVVADDTMADSLPRGAVVYGEVVPAEELGEGDLVIVRAPVDGGRWVTRRIVAVGDEGVVTRADGTTEPDPWLVPLDTEPALVSFYVPLVGYPALVASPLVWATVLLMVAASVTVVRRLRRTPRRRPGAAPTTSASPSESTAPLP